MSTMIVITLFGIMLLTMLTRVVLPMGQKPQGTPIRQVVLPFRQRLLYHRTSIYMIGVTMVLGGLGGWLSFAYQVIIVAATFAIVGMKIRYHFTTGGVGMNNVVFREWDEFASVEGDPRSLKIVAKDTMRPFKIILPPGEGEEITRLVGRLVKYGGQVIEVNRPITSGLAQSRPAKKHKVLS